MESLRRLLHCIESELNFMAISKSNFFRFNFHIAYIRRSMGKLAYSVIVACIGRFFFQSSTHMHSTHILTYSGRFFRNQAHTYIPHTHTHTYILTTHTTHHHTPHIHVHIYHTHHTYILSRTLYISLLCHLFYSV